MSLRVELSSTRINGLQERIGYRFRNPDLLRQALVHKSWLNEVDEAALESNERLEFLGDAILGAVVARDLFERFPDTSEGWLTVSRARIVRNQTLARVAELLDLGSHLLLGAGIANQGGRARPRVLSRTLEAVFGAVWLDGGSDAARGVILRLLAEELEAINTTEFKRDAKSQLQHLIQADAGLTPQYEITSQSGPPHDRRFRARVSVGGESIGSGEGTSKQEAEMAAAKTALTMRVRQSETADGP